MIAVVFAAGIGSRLKPFTDHHPKALAPVAGTTALDYNIRKLISVGARRVIVNVHHFANQVCTYLAEQPYADLIDISDESEQLLDTGGALAKMWRENPTLQSSLPSETVIIHNADIITDFDLTQLAAASRSVDAAVLVDPQRNSTRGLLFDSEKRLHGWLNSEAGLTKPAGLCTDNLQSAAFGGVHAMNVSTLAVIDSYCGEALKPFSIIDFYIDKCADCRICAFTPAEPYHWHDIGTPAKLDAARRTFGV